MQASTTQPHSPSSPRPSATSLPPRKSSLVLSFNLSSPSISSPSPSQSHTSQPSSPVSSIFSSSGSTMSSETPPSNLAEMAEDHYFGTNPPPKHLDDHTTQADAFIKQHAAANRKVVLVTSGGTTVPLEKQTVRFIDNFSAGTRGATSAEYFLEAGYAVIFLHRQFSLLPYSRHYSHATDCFLDFLAEGRHGNVVATETHRSKMLSVLRKYTAAKENNMLLMLPFVTITDYLYELRAVAQLLRPLGPNGLLYLAAAVSDFFVPPDRMAEHKIQSTDAADNVKNATSGKTQKRAEVEEQEKEKAEMDEETFDNFDSSPTVPRSKRLVVDLDPVPKFLKNLVDGWAPEGMIVSFKLETDPEILVHKAKYSLNRYQHHLVIGNLLATRKWEVVFVHPSRKDRWIRVPMNRRKHTISGIEGLVGAAEKEGEGEATPSEDKPMDPKMLPEGEPVMEIEGLIIPAVEELHEEHIRGFRERKGN
ncbi:putative dna pantothenate metabolism flavoprotein [Zalerion maritima]|uniref:Dna pantothenate metabolism flavoprotein n=1 Tax=Zalerion maritima TaxID=339359 RepID=A0AAD5WMS5_9PEZI|nr:putative dna pantothenate metabolism flavoprotein [Zalerion maritima]